MLARKKEVKPVSGVLHKAVSIIDAAAEEAVDEVDEEEVDDDDDNDNEDQDEDEADNHAALLKLLLLCLQVNDAHLIFSCPIAKAFYVIKRNRCESLIAQTQAFLLFAIVFAYAFPTLCLQNCPLLCCITSANRVCTF